MAAKDSVFVMRIMTSSKYHCHMAAKVSVFVMRIMTHQQTHKVPLSYGNAKDSHQQTH